MKICWLCPYQLSLLDYELKGLKVEDRAVSWIKNLSEALAMVPTIELHIITFSSKIPFDQNIVKNGINFHIIKYHFPLFKNKVYTYYLQIHIFTFYYKLKKKITRIVKSINPDIVHGHGSESVYGLSILDLQSKYPTVLSLQGIIGVISKIEKRPDFQSIIERFVFKRLKNAGTRTEWDTNYIKSYNKNIEVHYLPEAINEICFQNTWNLIKTSCEITFVGTIIERKGIKILLDAYKLLQKQNENFKLNIIGSGRSRDIDFYKDYANNLGISQKVVWHGFLKTDEIVKILLSSRIFVLPTLVDNSPNSLFEAMALGMPCIASNIGGIPSIIKHETNGLLCKPNDSNDLLDKFITIIDDDAYALKIAKAAKESVFKNNYPHNVSKITIDAYQKIVNSFSKY